MIKQCGTCYRWKNLKNFYPRKDAFYKKRGVKGHSSECKECIKRKRSAFYKNNKAAIDKRHAEWRKANPEKVKEVCRRAWKKHHEKHPERSSVYSSVSYAIKTKRVKKPKRCSRCGKKSRLIHGHHSNYAKKLKVKWLCPKCHKLLHKRRNENGNRTKS